MTDATESVYLDFAASTPVDARVVRAMSQCLATDGGFANPSSVHAAGRQANDLIDKSARQLGRLLNTDPARIVWTSGATESDNLAIIGTARHRQHRGRHLVTMRSEHKAVTDAMTALENQGFEVSWLDPREDGLLEPEVLESAIRPETQLVSIMHVNNETGVIQDIAAIGRLCRDRDVVFHVDAAQSAGKLPIDLDALPVDLMSMTAHKMYGPKGIGALYIADRDTIHIEPLLHGGGQQRGLRPGTLATHQIVGFGEAAEIAREHIVDDLRHLRMLKKRFVDGIADIPGIAVNGAAGGFPGILNVSVEAVEGECLLLDLEPLCVATGSACNSLDRQPSGVLRSMGLSDAMAQSAIRFSFGRPTTPDLVDFAVQKYRAAVGRLRAMAPAEAA